MYNTRKLRALFIIPTDYASLQAKGVAWIMNERDEGGYLERVITIHPTASQTQTIQITSTQQLFEFKEFFLPGTSRFRLLRLPHHAIHLFRLYRAIRQLMKREKIDFIRAFDPLFTGFLAWLVTRGTRSPYCVSIHADYDKRFELSASEGNTLFGSRRLARRLETFLLNRAQAVMPIRESIGKKVAENGVDLKRIRILPHGIDLRLFRNPPSGSLRQQLNIPTEVPILSFAGRLSRDNYVYDLLELAQGLCSSKTAFHLVVVGDGPEKQALYRYIEAEGLSAYVTLLGFQPRELVIELRKESAISLCLMGGFSLIEAAAAGHPTIAYDVEWHYELVKTRETGWLVPEGDKQALIDAVRYLLNHPDEAERMGQAARALALERHDLEKTSELKRRYYRDLVEAANR